MTKRILSVKEYLKYELQTTGDPIIKISVWSLNNRTVRKC
jgi:hypothetical protein